MVIYAGCPMNGAFREDGLRKNLSKKNKKFLTWKMLSDRMNKLTVWLGLYLVN